MVGKYTLKGIIMPLFSAMTTKSKTEHNLNVDN